MGWLGLGLKAAKTIKGVKPFTKTGAKSVSKWKLEAAKSKLKMAKENLKQTFKKTDKELKKLKKTTEKTKHFFAPKDF